MERSKFLKSAGEPRFIPGIYNYCDRWCERCAYTSRCFNYNMMKEEGLEGDDDNMDQEQFWKQIEKTFQRTKELLTHIAREQGIDLDNLEVDEELEEKSARKEKLAKEHSLAKNSLKYIKMVQDWLQRAERVLQTKENELNSNLRMGVAEDDTRKIGHDITDALEVIRWYHFQINVKLMRALSNDHDRFDAEDEDDYQNDADGSAKVALIGMDRSISAWGVLHEELPELADEILDFLVLLEQLRRRTEQEFPEARNFVRPGFDTDHEPVYYGP